MFSATTTTKQCRCRRRALAACFLTFGLASALQQQPLLGRRAALSSLSQGGSAALLWSADKANAADATTAVTIEFAPAPSGEMTASARFEVPKTWQATDTREASSGGRRLVVYSDPSNSDVNVFLLITPVRGDYTSLGSFGSLDSVQDTIIPSGPDVEAAVLSAKTSPNRYNYEYVIQVPDQPKRHLFTAFTLLNDNIVTFTTQAREADYSPAVATALNAVAATFSLTKLGSL